MRGQISTAAKPCPENPELLGPGSTEDLPSRALSLSAVAASGSAAASLARRVAIAAINRPIASRPVSYTHLLRSIAASEGFTVTASELGKLKTVVQIVSVVSAILAHRWDSWQIGPIAIPVKWYAIAAIYFAALVAIISAVDYFIGFWRKIDHASKDGRVRRRAAVLSRGKSVRIS